MKDYGNIKQFNISTPAKEEHRSVSNYIRMILTEFVKHKRQEPNATTRAAIDEARSDMDLEELDVDHFKDFVASL